MQRFVFPVSLWRVDRSGHASIEYSMIATFIALGLVMLIMTIGVSVEGMFTPLAPAFAAQAR